ncbi:MAG: nitroreductase family protein [Victivallaceae bacterium]
MEFSAVVQGRRTVRRFKQVQLKESELREMLDAARLSSCGGNIQPLRYIVIRTPELVSGIFENTAWGGLVKPRRNPEPGRTAPLTFIAVVSPRSGNSTLHADAGAAIQSMTLTAYSLGIGCCWIGAFRRENVDMILALPEDLTVIYLLAVGYPDESPVQEDIAAGMSANYYLDDNDVLHVPKFTVDAITQWR